MLAGLVTRRRAEVALFEKPVSKPKPDLHLRLKRAYQYRAHLRRVLIEQHCRVPRPNRHCRGVLYSGAIVNRTIKQLHAQHIY